METKTDPNSSDFPTDVRDVPECVATEVLDLSDDEVVELRIAPVVKRLGGSPVRMLSYNGSIPGPTMKVGQGSEVVVNVVSDGDLVATVDWNGVRSESGYDATQAPRERSEV